MKWLLALALGITAYLATGGAASTDHFIYLPGVPGTPLMQQIIGNQSYTYCMDTRASTYPNFASQLADVNAQYAARVGVRADLVAFGPGCMVQHVMPTGIACDGWAARIWYANWPAKVEYCYTLGYQDWRSAQGHELGHGILGLHEMYKDSGGTIMCTGRQWTVMDCGGNPPVRYPQPTDVDRGCAIIKTAWCGMALATWTQGPDGVYYDQNGESEWCCQQPYGGVYNRRLDQWFWDIMSTWTWREADPVWRCSINCP